MQAYKPAGGPRSGPGGLGPPGLVFLKMFMTASWRERAMWWIDGAVAIDVVMMKKEFLNTFPVFDIFSKFTVGMPILF